MIELVAAAKALADPNRVRILAALRDGELCVCELCDALKLTQSTLSTHLQVIRNAGLVRSRRLGKWSYYAITPRTRPLLESVFRFHRAELSSDRRLLADARRLGQRLGLREKGECCVGFQCGSSPGRSRTR